MLKASRAALLTSSEVLRGRGTRLRVDGDAWPAAKSQHYPQVGCQLRSEGSGVCPFASFLRCGAWHTFLFPRACEKNLATRLLFVRFLRVSIQ